jgi:hypothetical protein
MRGSNHRRLLDLDKLANTKFVVIGAGAIGSFTVLALSKMGAKKIVVYDFDTLEEHNFDNQMYPASSLGQLKVDALQDVAMSYGECLISKQGKWIPETAHDGDIIICAVDNMDVRAEIWEHYRHKNPSFFIDGRMSALVYRVYGVDMENQDARDYYLSTLYPQSEASEEPCGEKSIIYTVLAVSAQVCSQVKKFIQGEHRPTEVIYDLYNDAITKHYDMTERLEIIDVPEELNV